MNLFDRQLFIMFSHQSWSLILSFVVYFQSQLYIFLPNTKKGDFDSKKNPCHLRDHITFSLLSITCICFVLFSSPTLSYQLKVVSDPPSQSTCIR